MLIGGVWVTSGPCVAGLTTARRTSLFEMRAPKQVEHDGDAEDPSSY